MSVVDFGAAGDGVTDDSGAFQKAVDALPEHGGRICVPRRSRGYLIGEVRCGTKAIEWEGQGGPGQSLTLGHGATELIVKAGAVGIIFGDGKNNLFRGPVLRDLRLVAQSPAALGGLLFLAVSTAYASNVVCSNFSAPGSYGWKFDGTNADARFPSTTMYNDLHSCGANNCSVGVWGVKATGLRMFGGLLDANDNRARKVVAGSTGVLWQAPGDTVAIFGTRFQSYETHIDTSCPGTFISGSRHEGFDVGIRIAADYCTVIPGEMDNSIVGGVGTAISLVSGKQAFVLGSGITAVATRISRGSATNYIIIDRGTFESAFTDGTAGLLLASDTNLYRPNGVPNVLRTDDQFRAADGVTTKTVAGTISDGSFVVAPPDGTIAVDTVHNKLYVRVNGTWLFATLQAM